MQPTSSSWWSRNWKWVLPAGCVGIIAAPILFLGGIGGAVFLGLRSSDVYSTALQLARANEEVRAVLGEPIKAGWSVSGNLTYLGSSADVDMEIPITGPSGECTVHIVGEKLRGTWSYERVEAECEGRPGHINLMVEDEAAASP